MAKKKKKNRWVGRPTKYKKKYCEELVEFFNVDVTEEKTTTTLAYGQKIDVPVTVACPLPTFESFCTKIGVVMSTLNLWIKTHDEFSKAYMLAKQMQKNHLLQNGLTGRYNSNFAKFVAMNCSDMVERVETTNHEITETYEEMITRLRKEKN